MQPKLTPVWFLDLVKKLQSTVEHLHRLGCGRSVITSDHGFCFYRPEHLVPAGLPHRREQSKRLLSIALQPVPCPSCLKAGKWPRVILALGATFPLLFPPGPVSLRAPWSHAVISSWRSELTRDGGACCYHYACASRRVAGWGPS